MDTDFVDNTQCIVVGPDHYNTLNVVRSLGRNHIIPYIVLVSPRSNNVVTTSRYAKYGIKIKDYTEISQVLKNLPCKKKRVAIIATNDRSISAIDCVQDELKHRFLLPNCGLKQGGLIDSMDKSRQMELARRSGLSVPKSILIDLSKTEIPEGVSYPCFVKPLRSIYGSKDDMAICDNPNTLSLFLQSISDHVQLCIAQQYITNKRGFVVCGVRTPNKHTYIPGIVEKIKMGETINTKGLNAFSSILPINDELKNKCISFLDALDYHGPFSLEFVSDEEKPGCKDMFFIEANLRSDAVFYLYDSCRISLPYYWIKSLYGEDAPEVLVKRAKFGITEPLYLKQHFKLANLSANLRDILKAKVFCYFRVADPLPFFAKFFLCR